MVLPQLTIDRVKCYYRPIVIEKKRLATMVDTEEVESAVEPLSQVTSPHFSVQKCQLRATQIFKISQTTVFDTKHRDQFASWSVERSDESNFSCMQDTRATDLLSRYASTCISQTLHVLIWYCVLIGLHEIENVCDMTYYRLLESKSESSGTSWSVFVSVRLAGESSE